MCAAVSVTITSLSRSLNIQVIISKLKSRAGHLALEICSALEVAASDLHTYEIVCMKLNFFLSI